MRCIIIVSTLMALVAGVLGGWDPNSKSTVAIYWGQNSYRQSSGELAQQRLSNYCNNPNVDIIILAFLLRFKGAGGQPVLNFANQGDRCSVFSGTEFFNCPELAADIPECQRKGKTILLSIGGDSYTEGGFPTSAAAIETANSIWAQFGPPQSGSNALRPFGSASVDGFDFDFESTTQNMVPFANRLRTLIEGTSDRKFILTAAPQCPFPDAYNTDLLNNVVLDIVWPQFYNNYCGAQSFVPGSADQNNFNFKQWDEWARTVSKNRDVRLLVGIPGNTGAAGSGYLPADRLNPVWAYTKKYATFGGVMIWDMSQVVANGAFLADVKKGLASARKREVGWRA